MESGPGLRRVCPGRTVEIDVFKADAWVNGNTTSAPHQRIHGWAVERRAGGPQRQAAAVVGKLQAGVAIVRRHIAGQGRGVAACQHKDRAGSKQDVRSDDMAPACTVGQLVAAQIHGNAVQVDQLDKLAEIVVDRSRIDHDLTQTDARQRGGRARR